METGGQTKTYSCPLAAVDRRLQDAHIHWHQAEKQYFHPEEFRIAIQTVIQTLRTVTFILQSNKDKIPEFDEWYGIHQNKLKNDPLMRWMVDARNKIEKEGDLEVHSFVGAEVFASYLREEVPSIEVPAHLFDDTPTILQGLPRSDVGDHIFKHGALKIQRRWVENTLPDYELLDATAIAYGKIAEIVRDAHRQIGVDEPATNNLRTGQHVEMGARGGRMPCMIGHAEARSINVRLSDGCLLRQLNRSNSVSRKPMPKQ